MIFLYQHFVFLGPSPVSVSPKPIAKAQAYWMNLLAFERVRNKQDAIRPGHPALHSISRREFGWTGIFPEREGG